MWSPLLVRSTCAEGPEYVRPEPRTAAERVQGGGAEGGGYRPQRLSVPSGGGSHNPKMACGGAAQASEAADQATPQLSPTSRSPPWTWLLHWTVGTPWPGRGQHREVGANAGAWPGPQPQTHALCPPWRRTPGRPPRAPAGLPNPQVTWAHRGGTSQHSSAKSENKQETQDLRTKGDGGDPERRGVSVSFGDPWELARGRRPEDTAVSIAASCCRGRPGPPFRTAGAEASPAGLSAAAEAHGQRRQRGDAPEGQLRSSV